MKAQLLATLDKSRTYTIAVATAMPEDKYDTNPAKDVWHFADLLNHIGYGIRWWESNYIRKVEMEWNPPVLPVDKANVMEYLQASYDILQQTVGTTELTAEAVQGFHASIDHVTHHRGQATIYLRSNGIVPPEYVY